MRFAAKITLQQVKKEVFEDKSLGLLTNQDGFFWVFLHFHSSSVSRNLSKLPHDSFLICQHF